MTTRDDPGTSLSERIARVVFEFLDLSRDLDRNQRDANFCKGGGRINYVIDAGVAELFLDFQDGRGLQASLHTADWRVGSSQPAWWRGYVAQTALATCDFIFGGSLPGQIGGRLYQSYWHRWELARRVKTLAAGRAKTAGPGARDVIDRFLEVTSSLAHFAPDNRVLRHDLVDKGLEQDYVDYRSSLVGSFTSSQVLKKELERFLRIRMGLRVLAEDQTIEPAEQLRRLLSPPISRRFVVLVTPFPQPRDRAEVVKSGAEWFGRLVEECRRRRIQIDDGAGEFAVGSVDPGGEIKRRAAAALWDDARTIAQVQYTVKTQDGAKEQSVLLTADTLVFDCYRRWWASLRLDDISYSQPFFMRRIRQYAPSLNFLDSGRVEGEQFRTIFVEMSELVELLLLPMNLASDKPTANPSVISRMRELTALRLSDEDGIIEDPNYKVFSGVIKDSEGSLREKLETLLGGWRALERAALGQAADEVSRRLLEAERRFGVFPPRSPERAQAVENYVSNVVGQIQLGTRAFSQPLARAVIERWTPDPAGSSRRAPIALRLVLELAGEEFDVGAALDSRLESGPGKTLLSGAQWEELFRQHHALFSVASGFSIASGDWADAEHFADLALQSLKLVSTTNVSAGVAAEMEAEIMYLAALAKRFQLGDLSPPLSDAAYKRAVSLFNDALDLGHKCVGLYGQYTNPTLRGIRSYSERAALRLFYAAALNPKIRKLAIEERAMKSGAPGGELGSLSKAPSINDAIDLIDKAEDDLRYCFQIDNLETTTPSRTEFKQRLRRQIYTNAASSHLLRRLWGRDAPRESLFSPDNPAALGRAQDMVVASPQGTVMHADIEAFKALGGDRAARETLRSMRKLTPSRTNLRLDVFVVEALKRLI